MSTVHWLGAGLSSGPGIRRTAASGVPMILWNRTVSKAEEALKGRKSSNVSVRALDLLALAKDLKPGDVVVSMLPAPMHPEIAGVCMEKRAHFVSTSYVSDAMRGLHAPASERGLSFINEAGLDPGLDHMMAHWLVSDYRASKEFTPANQLYFRSYCGGFPKVPNEFKYKFSWSPAGVLRALKNPARFIEGGAERKAPAVWDAVKPWACRGEDFEVYPNRDSVPYVQEYGFDPSWTIQEFVRGTIRLDGWSERWKNLFTEVAKADDAKVQALSDDLWSKYAYNEGEPDRVLLSVELEAKSATGAVAWRRSLILDEAGTRERTAMGYLVSVPASLAIEEILGGRAPKGVSGAPHEPETIQRWFDLLAEDGIRLHKEV